MCPIALCLREFGDGVRTYPIVLRFLIPKTVKGMVLEPEASNIRNLIKKSLSIGILHPMRLQIQNQDVLAEFPTFT